MLKFHWIIGLLLCAAATLQATESTGKPPTLAIVGVIGAQADPGDVTHIEAAIALLETELSQNPAITLVERQARDAILKELDLTLTALNDAQTPLRIGRMLNANLIVWGKIEHLDDKPVLIFRIVESTTGVIRGISVAGLDESILITTVRESAAEIARLTRSAKPPTATVAVGVFENAGQFERLRPMAFLLRDRMTDELLRRPSLRVVQRAAMRSLIDEIELIRAGLTETDDRALPSRQATYLLRGSFDDVVGSQPPRMKVRMELVSLATGKTVLEHQAEIGVEDLDDLCSEWAGLIDQQTSTTADPHPQRTAVDEADALRDQAIRDLEGVRGAERLPTLPLQHGEYWLRMSTHGQPLHAALVRQAIERLECVLFIRPDDLTAKALLASALAVREPDTWDWRRAMTLYREVYLADPHGALGIHALKQIPTVHLDAYFGFKPPNERDRRAMLREVAATYGDVSEKLTEIDLAISMRYAHQAARWYLEAEDPDSAMIWLRALIDRGMLEDPSRRPTDHFVLEYTAGSLVAIAHKTPARAPECRELLEKWTAHQSHYLRYIAHGALADLAYRNKDYDDAGRQRLAAAEVCRDQKDNWFHIREEMARAAAGEAFLKGGDHAAGLAAMQPLASRFDDGGVLQRATVIALGDLYEASGQIDLAVKLFGQFEHVRKTRHWHVSTALTERYEAALRKSGQRLPRLVLKMQMQHEMWGLQTVVSGGDRLWLLGGGELFRLDPRTGDALTIKRPADINSPTTIAWTGGWLYLGTARDGLWRISTEDENALSNRDRWEQVEGVPDRNITALVPGDGGDLYAGVGVITTGKGGPIKGGVVRIDLAGQVHPLHGGAGLAPERLVWMGSKLWAQHIRGTYVHGLADDDWTRLEGRVTRHLNPGREKLIAVQVSRRPVYAHWIDPADPNADEMRITAEPDLLTGFAVETPRHIWFGGRSPIQRSGYGLQCFDKSTNRLVTVDPESLPSGGARAGIWFRDRLWLVTATGLMTVESQEWPE